MSGILAAIEAKRGGGDFTPQQVAAISTLCERLVQSNEGLSGFVAQVRAAAEEESRLRGDNPSWRALARHI
jgi:hypothetical protein